MNAKDVHERVLEKYQSCSSYSDFGMVDFDNVHEQPETLQFRTSFIRPNYLIFEWQDYGPRRGKSQEFSQLWSKNGRTKTRMPWGLKESESLHLGIAGATGCSAGAASVIPDLLLPETNSKGFTQLSELDLDPQGLETDDCYVLRGTLFKYLDHTVWISKIDFSIRRLRHDRSWTAAESKLEYELLQADTKLLDHVKNEGLKLPSEQPQFKPKRFVTDYKFQQLKFDETVFEIPEPL